MYGLVGDVRRCFQFVRLGSGTCGPAPPLRKVNLGREKPTGGGRSLQSGGDEPRSMRPEGSDKETMVMRKKMVALAAAAALAGATVTTGAMAAHVGGGGGGFHGGGFGGFHGGMGGMHMAAPMAHGGLAALAATLPPRRAGPLPALV